jgi:hypothetical protein
VKLRLRRDGSLASCLLVVELGWKPNSIDPKALFTPTVAGPQQGGTEAQKGDALVAWGLLVDFS